MSALWGGLQPAAGIQPAWSAGTALKCSSVPRITYRAATAKERLTDTLFPQALQPAPCFSTAGRPPSRRLESRRRLKPAPQCGTVLWGSPSGCGGLAGRLAGNRRMVGRLPCIFLLLIFASSVFAADEPQISFTKSFKGSTPAYVAITVNKSGHGSYKEAPDDDNPLEFDVPADQVAEAFALAGKLDHFIRPIESHLKVANTGTKTFGYIDGAEKHETAFNYSLDPSAQLLLTWFENLSETEQIFIDLDRTAHFDKLGVNDALLQLNILWDQKRLVTPLQFLALLNRIGKDESIMHMARERAATLADQFQKPPAQEKPAP